MCGMPAADCAPARKGLRTKAAASAVNSRRRVNVAPCRYQAAAAAFRTRSRGSLRSHVIDGRRPLLKMIVAVVQVLDEVLELGRREVLLRRVAAALDLMLQCIQRADHPVRA